MLLLSTQQQYSMIRSRTIDGGLNSKGDWKFPKNLINRRVGKKLVGWKISLIKIAIDIFQNLF